MHSEGRFCHGLQDEKGGIDLGRRSPIFVEQPVFGPIILPQKTENGNYMINPQDIRFWGFKSQRISQGPDRVHRNFNGLNHSPKIPGIPDVVCGQQVHTVRGHGRTPRPSHQLTPPSRS